MTTASGYATERVPVGQTQLFLMKGGQGRPMLVLHGVEGHEGWLSFHERLAEHATVFAPSHPGYGQTDCPDWISSVQHQAVFYNWFLDELGTDSVDVVGIGVGGWIAAEMAVMSSARLHALILVNAAGLRPQTDELLDIFLLPWRQVIDRGFFDKDSSTEYQRIYSAAPVQDFGGPREAGRVMSMRMCFKPYLHDPSLAGMLAKLRVPTLLVWGKQDAVIPLECAELYQSLIPGAVLRTINGCGHFAHLEQPRQLAEMIHEFVSE